MLFIHPPHCACGPFGRLEIVEVYVDYDGPRLFLCRNLACHLYLTVWVDEDDASETWLYVAVSAERARQVRSGSLDLRTAFAAPEDGVAHVATVSRSDAALHVETKAASDVPESWLPADGERLHLPTDTMPRLLPADVATLARQRRRDVLGVRVSKADSRITEASLGPLGQLLHALQSAVEAIAQVLAPGGTSTLRGKIPERITSCAELRATGFYSGSFGVEVTVAAQSDLFGQSTVSASLEELLGVIAVGADQFELRERLVPLRGRVAAKYKHLLDRLVESESDISIDWSSTTPGRQRSVQLTLGQARAAIAVVSEVQKSLPEPFEAQVILIGGNTRARSFEFSSVGDDLKYSGRVLDSALGVFQHASLNEKYTATIQPIYEVAAATGEERVRYELVALAPVGAAECAQVAEPPPS